VIKLDEVGSKLTPLTPLTERGVNATGSQTDARFWIRKCSVIVLVPAGFVDVPGSRPENPLYEFVAIHA